MFGFAGNNVHLFEMMEKLLPGMFFGQTSLKISMGRSSMIYNSLLSKFGGKFLSMIENKGRANMHTKHFKRYLAIKMKENQQNANQRSSLFGFSYVPSHEKLLYV